MIRSASYDLSCYDVRVIIMLYVCVANCVHICLCVVCMYVCLYPSLHLKIY